MSDTIKSYRVYCFDARHKAVTADMIDAPNDEAAVAAALARGFGTKCELWDGRRMVAELHEHDRLQA